MNKEIILGFVLNKPREFILAHPEYKISFKQKLKFKRLIKKRNSGVPLAYILGKKEFFGLDFLVNKHVLIPRPETEILVEEVLKNITRLHQSYGGQENNTLLIDIGTGSGCIPISILKNLQPTTYNLQPIGIDISRKALKIAKKNAKKHNPQANGNIKFLHGNLLEPIIKNINLIKNYKHIIITANLPYLTQEQFIKEPSIKFEPKTALISDKNSGLDIYEKLLKQIKFLTTTYNLIPTTYLEIDPRQTEKIKIIIKKYFPKAEIKIKTDLAGLDRVVIIKI